jgi:hypothetical protein
MCRRPGPHDHVPAATETRDMEPILCSQADACKMLAIGKTKLGELISNGRLETASIGTRRLVMVSSIKRLAGVKVDPTAAA